MAGDAEADVVRSMGYAAALGAIGGALSGAATEAEAREILRALPLALDVTRANAPVREQPYEFQGCGPFEAPRGEWGRAIWREHSVAGCCDLIPGVCHRLVGRWVALDDAERSPAAIDLLGVNVLDQIGRAHV